MVLKTSPSLIHILLPPFSSQLLFQKELIFELDSIVLHSFWTLVCYCIILEAEMAGTRKNCTIAPCSQEDFNWVLGS